ncbi:MAG: hypothetical protein ACLQPH_00120 [Acidimicrobiales bacterium]
MRGRSHQTGVLYALTALFGILATMGLLIVPEALAQILRRERTTAE